MIADTFIRRPVTAIVISVVIIMVGILAIIDLPVSQYPDISPPTVSVSGTFTGADAQTVEETVTTPVEIQINGTPGMSYMSSTSTNDGRMNTTITFDIGTDVDIAALDVQNRVKVAEPVLPEEVRRLGITTRKQNPAMLMVIAVFSPNGTRDEKFLDNYTNIYLRDALLRVPGVGDVRAIGQDYSMRIWLDPDKLAQLGLTTADVANTVRDQNLQIAGGSVGTAPQYSTQAFEYSILLNGRLTNEKEFENIVVKTNPGDGSLVYLKDIARIELGQFNYANYRKTNGKPSGILLVYQTPEGNAIETADGVTRTLEELKETFPNDVDYSIPFESVTVVEVSINEVVHTLVEALILVTFVVFLFLQSWRATLIPFLAIPVSIIGTFILFTPLGFTINTLTMFGFVLSIGIVVDDAIVVVEAVQHYIDTEKISAKEATRRAMKDISGPVIAMALVLAAVFIPVGFIPGMVGRLYQQFAITIAVSVLISAFVALSLTPALCSLLLRPTRMSKESRGINWLFYRFNAWFHRITRSYSNGVRRCIKAAPLAIIILICIYVGTVGMFGTKATGFIPTEDEGRVYIAVNLPEGAASARTRVVLDSITHIIEEKFPEISGYTYVAGLNAINFSFKSNSGTFFTQLKPWDDREAHIDDVIARLQQEFRAIKEANIQVVTPPAVPGMGRTGGFSFLLQQRASGSVQELEEVANRFMMAANQREEIGGAFTFFNAQTPSYQVEVDRVKARRLGVPLSSVYNTISNYMGSLYINDFVRYGRNFRVVAQADTTFRKSIDNLNDYYVRSEEGTTVPLSALISYRKVENASMISHYNLFRSAEFNGNAAPGYSSGQAIQALREVADEVLPAGYGYEFSGLTREEIQAGGANVIIFSLSIVFVFLILAALYESLSVPFAILLGVPLGAFGAITTLMFFPSLTNNIYAQIGLITLIGLSAKNAILIVEFAKERVDWGMDVVKATIEAVKLRLRPIIMTSFAFILGVLPLAFSGGAGAMARRTIGWTVFGGMLSATMLAIFVIPVLFVLITRLAYGKKKLAELQANYKPEEHEDRLHSED